jgi:LMBR1 domain-containing protein 1
VFVAILIAINIYLLAYYVHSDDKGWGTALYCKVLVVLGLTLCQAQALMVPLDVANVSNLDLEGIDMKSFWFFVYIIVLTFVCLLLPFALFFYETDEEDGMCKRIGKSIGYTLAANIISILLLFITWSYFKYVDLPVYEIKS